MASDEDIRAEAVDQRPIVLYQSSLTLWRLRLTLDLWIIDHAHLAVLEIIAFKPDLRKEHRLYLDKALLLSKRNASDLQKLLRESQEEHIRQRKPFDPSAQITAQNKEYITNYITKRINLPADLTEDAFRVELRANFGDHLRGRTSGGNDWNTVEQVLDVVLDGPTDELVPYEVVHKPKLSSQEVMQAIDSFSNEQVALARFTHVVGKIVSTTTTPLSPTRDGPKRVRGSALLRSIDDNYIMECTSFWTAASTPGINDLLVKAKNMKLEPIGQEPITPTSHGNHIPGLKLLKKVGSFKFSGDPEATYGHDMGKQMDALAELPEGVSEKRKPAEHKEEHKAADHKADHKTDKKDDKARYLADTKSSKKKVNRIKSSHGMMGSFRKHKSMHKHNKAQAKVNLDDIGIPVTVVETAETLPEEGEPADDQQPSAAPPTAMPSTKEKVLTRMRSRAVNRTASENQAKDDNPEATGRRKSLQRRFGNIRDITQQYEAGMSFYNK